MARRALICILLVATGATLTACSSSGSTPDAGSAADTSAADAPPPTSTTSSPPGGTTPATVRNTPECEAFARYKLAELILGTGTDEQKRLAVEAIAKAYDDVQRLLPQYRVELQQQYDTLRRSLAGQATEEDRTRARAGLAELDTWYRTTCLEPAPNQAGAA